MAKQKYSWLIFLVLATTVAYALQGSQRSSSLNRGSSLAIEREEFLVSPGGTFTCGFYKVGTNAFCFSIWFTNSVDKTVVWMANRDRPVNGQGSKLTLGGNGNLVLTDADGSVVWSTSSQVNADSQLQLLETGNLVLMNQANARPIWESFGFPTDTLLASQPLTRNTTLVSMRSPATYLSGFYNLKFDDTNILNLIYNGPLLSSVYWPNSVSTIFDNGRTPYNSSRVAVLNELGYFISSDKFNFNASDYGIRRKRRLTLAYDGILRLYSLEESTGLWEISWLPGGLDACLVQGLCGANGICSYSPHLNCMCPGGFKMIDPSDWSKGCSPLFNLTCDPGASDFTVIEKVDYYGYDLDTYASGITFEDCRNRCLNDCRCKGFGYALDGQGQCFPKSDLLNGYNMPSNRMIMHIKVPKGMVTSFLNAQERQTNGLNCSARELVLGSNGDAADKTNKNTYIKYLIAFVVSIGAVEMIWIGVAWWYVFGKEPHDELEKMGYNIVLAMGFKRFSYAELKGATKNFKEEIGKGGFGTVYKGVLDDKRVVAVKRLEGVLQGEAEFWAEVSIIGKMNHRNLVKLWGFCAENEHKLLVYEYVENGSLDKALFLDSTRALGWDQRYNIAVGTAKGLSYLHEECLEWVLHCDVKPQNILLDDHFEPKVADFGMSKLFKDNNERGFSRVRGTRGYLAPEWMMNRQIDSKADVYSYGVVLLDLLTGKGASGFSSTTSNDKECNDFVQWVIQNIKQHGLGKIIDPRLGDQYNQVQLERLVEVALLCVSEDRSTRPAMSKVVELLHWYDQSKPSEEISSNI